MPNLSDSEKKINSEKKCKLAYAADGTLICDPTKSKSIYNYNGTPTCSTDAKCTIFGKTCIKKL